MLRSDAIADCEVVITDALAARTSLSLHSHHRFHSRQKNTLQEDQNHKGYSYRDRFCQRDRDRWIVEFGRVVIISVHKFWRQRGTWKQWCFFCGLFFMILRHCRNSCIPCVSRQDSGTRTSFDSDATIAENKKWLIDVPISDAITSRCLGREWK